jgi:hypothetical protein
MRVMVLDYSQGGRTAFEVSDDGEDVRGEWAGPRQVGERIAAFIDAGCDDSEGGVQRLLDALDWLRAEVTKRKGQSAENGVPVIPSAGS